MSIRSGSATFSGARRLGPFHMPNIKQQKKRIRLSADQRLDLFDHRRTLEAHVSWSGLLEAGLLAAGSKDVAEGIEVDLLADVELDQDEYRALQHFVLCRDDGGRRCGGQEGLVCGFHRVQLSRFRSFVHKGAASWRCDEDRWLLPGPAVFIYMSIVPEMGRDGEYSHHVIFYQLLTLIDWAGSRPILRLFRSFEDRPLAG